MIKEGEKMCNHEHLRCTDNVFYCIDCGERVPDPQTIQEKQDTVKTEDKPKKATRKRKGE